MIPYDDLVVALASWRARQGLPVVSSSVPSPRAQAITPTTPRPAAPPPPAVRATPPGAPPRGMPLPAPSNDDFDDGALIEEAAYDSGEDYVVPLGADIEPSAEPTAISSAPEMPRRGKRPNDW